LSAAQDKYRDFEDIILTNEREQEAKFKELDAVRKQLDTENAKRTQLEKSYTTQKAEVAKLKDRNAKLEKELNKTLTDLKAREWEVKQLLSKQDKTIVEHVHVLEEAKRVTDRQLQEARLELQKNQDYIRSLKVAKTKMSGEVEDATIRHEQDIRAKDHELKAQVKKTLEVTAQLETERRNKEETELQILRVRTELQQAQQHGEEVTEQLIAVQRSKMALENELDRLAEDAETGDSLAKMQRQYESRIAELENQLDESEMARATSVKISEQMERHHAEIKRLITASIPTDQDLQSKLLKQFELADLSMQKELSTRTKHPRLSSGSDLLPLSNSSTPRKQHNSSRAKPDAQTNKQVTVLKQQLQLLEIQLAASERVRQHLEASVRDLTAELDNGDGSKRFLENYKARLIQENKKLSALLHEEAEARKVAEAARIDGVQAIWSKFQKTIAEERENYARLEESRKALVRVLLPIYLHPMD